MAERDEFGQILSNFSSTASEIDLTNLDSFLNDEEPIEEIKKTTETVKPPKKEVGKPAEPKEEEVEVITDKDKDQQILEEYFGSDKDETLVGVKKETTEGEDPEEGSPEGEEEVNQWQEISNGLLENGIFSLNEGEEEIVTTTPDELLDRFHSESKKSAANVLEKFLSRFGEDYNEAFDAIFVKGVNPRDYYSAIHQQEDIEGLDLSIVDNQKFVLKEHYKSLGWDATKIAGKIEKLESYQDLEEESKDIHQVLIQKEKDKKEQLLYQQEQLNQRKAQAKHIYNQGIERIIQQKAQAKEFDGIPIDPVFAKETFSFLTEDRYQTKDGETLSEFDRYLLDLKKPENFEKRVKMAMLAQMLETDPTLSKIQKKAITKEVQKTFGKLVKHTEKQKTPQEKRLEADKITSFI